MGNRFVKNTSWIIAGKIVQTITGFVVSVFSARYLGPANLGILSYTASFLAFISSIATLGINGILIKELLYNKDRQGTVLGTSMVMRLVASTLSVLSCGLLLYVINDFNHVYVIVFILQGLVLFPQVLETISFWYHSQYNSKVPSIVMTIGYIAMTAYKLYILSSGKSIYWFAVVGGVESLVIGSITLFLYQRENGFNFSFDKEYARELFNSSKHFIIAGIMVTLYGRIDTIMIKHILDETQSGIYSIAITLCTFWVFILDAINQVSSPILTEAKQSSDELFNKRTKQLYGGILWIGIVVAICFDIFGGLVIKVLYGKQYLGAITPLRILIWSEGLAYVSTSRTMWLVNEGKQSYEKAFSLIGLVCNLTLNYVLINLMGISGAALATVISRFVVVFVAPIFFDDVRICSKMMFDSLNIFGLFTKEELKYYLGIIKKKA